MEIFENEPSYWYVSDLLSDGISDILQPTIYDNNNYVYQEGIDIKKRHYDCSQLGIINPDRTAYYNFHFRKHIEHWSIAKISLNYNIANELQLLETSKDLIIIATKIANEEYRDIFINNQIEAEKEVIDRLHSSPKMLSEEKKQLMSDCLFDEFLSGKNKYTAELVVNQAFDSKDFQNKTKDISRLIYFDNESRQSILVAGGVASGKGSIAKLVKEEILHNNALELNTDFYKNIILSKDIISSNYNQTSYIKFYGSISHNESSVVFDLIIHEWSKKAQKGKAPNLLVDSCRASNWIINIASSGNNSLEIYVANLDTEVALERAYERGEKTGRFVPSEYFLRSHKDQLFLLSRAINQYNIKISIYDTLERTPQLSIATDEKKKELYVMDVKSAIIFCSKININTQAKNNKTLYNVVDSFRFIDIIQNFAKNYVIKFYNQF